MKRNARLVLLGCGLVIGVVFSATPSVWAEDAATPATAPAAAPVNPAVAQEMALVQNLRAQAQAYAAKAEKCSGDLKAGAEGLAGAIRKEADARESLAKAIEAGDGARSSALNQEMPGIAARTVWAGRKLGALETAAELAKPLAENVVRDTPEPAKPALEALAAAQQASSKAWSKYAEAINPDAITPAVDEAFDDAQAGADSLKLASMAWSAATGAAYRKSAAAKFNNPELDRKIQEWEKSTQDLLEVMRQQNELTAKLRKLERALTNTDAARAAMAEKLGAEAKAKAASVQPAQ